MTLLNSLKKTLPPLLCAAVTGGTLFACSSSDSGSPEPLAQAGDELYLKGTPWPNSTAYVCYDTVDGADAGLRAEAQRVLAATWSHATTLTFPGGSALSGAQADWGPCDYNTTLNGNYQTIALHFCTGSTVTSHCEAGDYDPFKCTSGTCTTNAQCGTGGTCTAGQCTAGQCSLDSQCGTGGAVNRCSGVRRTGHYRGKSYAFGTVPPQTVGQFFTPGFTHVSLIGDDPDTYSTRFRYEVAHEFGHALAFRHEQDRPDNLGKCNNNANNTAGGTYLTSLFDGNSIMNYCSSDALNGTNLLTNPSSLDIDGARQQYQPLPSSHGFRILSDGDQTLAVNAYGGARVNGPLKLFKNCPLTNPDCTWRYQRGMILSDKDPTLAIKLVQDPVTTKYYLALATAALTDSPAGTYTCTPSKPECTWTWKLGQFQSDAPTSQTYYMNARGGATDLADVGVSPACTTANGACTWTMPDVMVTSERDVTLSVNAHGGAIDHDVLVLHNACNTSNNSCTFTFTGGMVKTTGNTNLAWNAYGGAHNNPDGTTLINSNCAANNPSCTWTWSHGELFSDDHSKGTFAMRAENGANGALHLANMLMSSSCTQNSPDCVFAGFWAKP